MAKAIVNITKKQKEMLLKKQIREKVQWLIAQEKDIKAREILTDVLTYNVNITLMELEGFTREANRITYKAVYERVLLKRLTNKQYKFCKTYIETGDVQVAKYKAGYRPTEQSNPLDLPLIQEYLDLFDSEYTKEKGNKIVLGNNDIQSILSEIAINSEEKTSDRLKALDILKNIRKNEVELRNKEEELARERANKESMEEINEETLNSLFELQEQVEKGDITC